MADIESNQNARGTSVSFSIVDTRQDAASTAPSSQQQRVPRTPNLRNPSNLGVSIMSNDLASEELEQEKSAGADNEAGSKNAPASGQSGGGRDPFADLAMYATELSDTVGAIERLSSGMAVRGLESVSKLQYTLRGISDRSGRTSESLDVGTKAAFIRIEKHIVDITLACRSLDAMFRDLDGAREDAIGRIATPSVIEQVANARHTPKIILPSSQTESGNRGSGISPIGMTAGGGNQGDMWSSNMNPSGGAGAAMGNAGQPKMFSKLPKEVLEANLPKPELMRLSAVYELIETEADYCRDLMTMINFYKVQMRESKIMSEQEITALFSNTDQLLAANQGLLARLQARRDQNPIVQEVGDLIADSAESLKVYTTYAANYPAAMKLVHQLQARPDLKETMQRWMNSPETRGLSLESFLIKPVQRICKYPLLLRELEKYTERAGNTADQAGLRTAAEKIEGVVMLVNEATRQAEERQRILTLESNIESPVPLGFAEKKHIRDGVLQRVSNGKTKDRYVILFTDVLFICKTSKTSSKYELEAGYSLAELTIRNDSRDTMKSRNNLIQLNVITSEEKEILSFLPSSEDDRTRWTDSFNLGFRDITEEHRSAFKSNLTASIRHSSFTDTMTMGRGTVKRNKISTRTTTLGTTTGILRKQVAARKSMMESWMINGTSNNANSLQEPELVDVAGVLHKRAISATGHIYYFAVTTKISIWRLPEGYTVVDAAGSQGQAASDADSQDGNAQNQDRLSMELEDDENIVLEMVDGYPDWRRVDRGDGEAYFFNIVTQETQWEPPGTSSDE